MVTENVDSSYADTQTTKDEASVYSAALYGYTGTDREQLPVHT